MTELEDRLRDMLHERSGDIDQIPARLLEIGAERPAAPTDLARGRHRPPRPGRSRAWLLSAAAVAVIALGLGVLFNSGGDPRPERSAAGTGRPTATAPTSTASTASTAPVGPRTLVSLDWFATDPVTNYTVLQRASEPGYREVSWFRKDETELVPDFNGGIRRSATATVFSAGRFPAAKSGVLQVAPESEAGTKVYRTEARRVTGGKLDGVLVPTVAWQYRPNAWAVVQAVTSSVANAELASLADAVHPTAAVAITLPFRLASPPAGRIEQIVDGRPDYPLVVTFRDGDSKTTEFQVRSRPDGKADATGSNRRLIGGLVGYVDSSSGAAVEFSGGALAVSKADGDKLDQRGLNTLLDGLTWSGGNGAGPGIPLRTAIGR